MGKTYHRPGQRARHRRRSRRSHKSLSQAAYSVKQISTIQAAVSVPRRTVNH